MTRTGTMLILTTMLMPTTAMTMVNHPRAAGMSPSSPGA